MNQSTLAAVVVFAAVLLVIYGALYVGAARSQARGELGPEGTRLLRWALLGNIVLYVILAITAFIA